MSKLLSEQELQQRIDALATEIKPERDLWTGIERAIEHQALQQSHSDDATLAKGRNEQQKSGFKAYYAWAASVCAAVVLTWYMGTPTPQQDIVFSPVKMIEQEYQQEKQAMLVGFGKPDLTKLPENIQQQFNELESARTSLLKALAEDPDNVDLLNLLKWTQQQELSLLEQLYNPKWQTI
ncbi:hypothetical protein [Thalassotalea aquiviva]|uniref:hypothetical protein n=1 Tax=Thalassotalea aquiviva TaxID=3242415 RepID=UPI003529D686